MFTTDIVPIAKVAIEHSEWHTLDYLLSQLFLWMDGPDQKTAIDAGAIAHMLIHAMEKDIALRSKYYVEVVRMQSYMEKTVNYLNSK